MSEVQKKPYTKPEVRELRPCPCGAKPGELHMLGCSVERCPLCGDQMIGCSCSYTVSGGVDPEGWEAEGHQVPSEEMYAKYDAEIEKYGGRLPWSGEYPGSAACRQFGWYVYEDKTKQGPEMYVRCASDHPGARPDLNRLNAWCGAEWDKGKRLWVFRGQLGSM